MSLNSAVRSESFDESVKALRQDAVKDSFFANGDGPWTIIYDEWFIKCRDNGGQFIALSQLNMRERVIRDVGWDVRKGEGIPESGNYYEIQESGDKELAIRISGERIEVRTPLLKRYLAARQLDAVLYIDSNVGVDYDGDPADLADLDEEAFSVENLTCYSRNVWRDMSQSGRIWTRFLAKRIIKAPPRERCRIWPWDKVAADEYPEFIISEDEYGEPVRWTCNPDSLRNYYGKNPDAPHYLTPVFFKPEVLSRYYDSDDYEVRDAYLSCGQLWGVNLDNGCLDYVSVFLGDIGRDIPQSHWDHWKAYNIAPIGRMSDAAIRRSFFNQSVESGNPEHRFKRAYRDLQEKWEEAWGWRLHRRAEELDAGVFSRLRIPVNETEAEFRAQSHNLALILVDLLNEKSLIQGMDRVSDERGLAKLKRFLENNEYEYVDRDISLLKKVQQMRSRIAAHASGSGGRAFLDKELGDRSHREYFVELIEESTQMLLDLQRFAMSHASALGG